jgi:transcriptional regulator with XRE-family HTH domain
MALPPSPPTRLRAWREAQHISLREAAHLTGFSEAMLSKIETGVRRARPATKLAIARGLGVPVGTIFLPENGRRA